MKKITFVAVIGYALACSCAGPSGKEESRSDSLSKAGHLRMDSIAVLLSELSAEEDSMIHALRLRMPDSVASVPHGTKSANATDHEQFSSGRFGSKDIHGNITLTVGAGYAQFTVADLRIISRANDHQDKNQTESAYHFDNCAFEEGIAYIDSQWAIIERIKNIRSRESLEAFGRILHGVQDFYSHSNWLETNLGKAEIPLWDFRTIPGQDICTGTYRDDAATGNALRSQSAPSHHKLNKDTNSKFIQSLFGGIGPDIIRGGPHAGKTYCDLAMEVAARSTSVMFDRYCSIK